MMELPKRHATSLYGQPLPGPVAPRLRQNFTISLNYPEHPSGSESSTELPPNCGKLARLAEPRDSARLCGAATGAYGSRLGAHRGQQAP